MKNLSKTKKPRVKLVTVAQLCAIGSFIIAFSTFVGYRIVVQYQNKSTITDTRIDSSTARCGDGKYSSSQHRSGTCSGHGGVAEWLESNL